ncbi:MAG: inositol monophosphatase family protein [Bacteroidales bacterium]
MNLEKITDQVIDLSKNTGHYILSEWEKLSGQNIQTKGLNDFVTYVDKTSEKKLVKGLNEILPEAGFIVEEQTTKDEGQDYKWIVDPLDGTTNYIHGITPFSISIALRRNEETIFGLVHELGHNEIFHAHEGGAAFLNGKKINVSGIDTIKESIIATGFPYNDFSRLNNYLKSLDYFMRNSHGIRRLGSAATDLAYTACGRFEAFYEYSLKPWDVAAGSFILKQAGGKVSDFNGGDNYLFGQEIVAASNGVFDEFLATIKKYSV